MVNQKRAKSETKGNGKYFKIVVQPKENFLFFRFPDVDKTGHIQRFLGKRKHGSWDIQALFVNKADAHIEGNKLIPHTFNARKLLRGFNSQLKHVKANIFAVTDQLNISKREKSKQLQIASLT